MQKTQVKGETWRNLAGAMDFFGSGRTTIEKMAKACNAKRKIGRRALYNVERMSKWLDEKKE